MAEARLAGYESAILRYLRLLWSNRKSRVGLVIIVLYALMATVGPLIVPKPIVTSVNPSDIFLPPQLKNPYLILGTGPIGDSILGDIVWGSRFILAVAFLTGIITTLLGAFVGIVSGYIGGLADSIIVMIINVLMTMPSLILILIIATMLKTSNPLIIAGILSITGWTGLALAVRSQVMALRSMPYIEASRVLGLGDLYIIFREIFPSLGSYIAINFMFNVEGAIYAAVGLYYLGVLPVSKYNWGVMINQALSMGAAYGTRAVYYLIFPSLAVILLMMGLTLFSFGIDEVTNPRLRK